MSTQASQRPLPTLVSPAVVDVYVIRLLPAPRLRRDDALVEPDGSRLLDTLDVDLVADERPDVLDLIPGRARERRVVSTATATRGRGRRERNKGGGRTHLTIVGRSSERPQPRTRTPLGMPIGSSISGRNMPLLPISIVLSNCSWYWKISSEGSV
jgi:hypothetical protein